MYRPNTSRFIVLLLLLCLAGPYVRAATPAPTPTTRSSPRPPALEDQWVVWVNDVGWMHLGTVREFRNPGPRSSEIWGGTGSEPLKHTKLLGPFPTREQAIAALEQAVTEVLEGYAPLAFPKTYLIGKLGGQEYKLGSEIRLKRVPLIKFSPHYLIHCTRTYTMYGPQDRDSYVMHHEPPKNGRFMTADGSGGWFTNEGTLVGGPYTTNYEICPILKRLNVKGVWLGQRYISCEDPWWLTVKPPTTPPAPQPDEEEPVEGIEERPPEEKPVPRPDDPARVGQLRRLSSLRDALQDADHDAKLALAQLGVQRLAAAKIRAKIALLQSALTGGDYSEGMRERIKEQIGELRERLSEIYKEQDKTIREVFETYDHLRTELEKEYQQSPSDDLKRTIDALKRQVEERRDMANLELYLASGQREKFHALCREYVGQGKYPDVVRLAQAMDYVENKDPRSALYALRKALEQNPSNRAAQEMLKSLELGYLRAMDDKTLGEAAAVRAALWEQLSSHGEPGFFGYLKDLFTTGITTSVSAIGGKPGSLADLAATMGDEAAVQHAGLLLIIRLREKGLALDQIRGLTNQAFIARIMQDFGQEVSDEQALKMRFSIHQAFRNPDVGRLMRQTREQFDIDLGKSYFGTEDFEATWQDWIGDAVNAKNVLLMLGPSAVVSIGGKAAGVGLMTGKELETALTVKDAFAAMIRLPELAEALGKTKTGQACVEELLKFERSTGFVSKALAEALVQQGIVEAGKAIGGPAGELAAEVLTALGIGDIDLTLKILKQSGVSDDAIEVIANRVRKAAQEVDEVRTPVKTYVQQLDDALQESADGKRLSDATEQALRQSREEVEERLSVVVRRAADDEASRLVQEEAEKLRALKRTIDDALDGKRPEIEVGQKVVKQLDDKADDAVRQVRQQDEVIGRLTRKVAPEKPAVGELTSQPPQKSKPLQEAVHDAGLESPAPPKAPRTPTEIKAEAERLRNVKYDAGGITQSADDAMRRKDYDEASRRYRELLAGGQLDDRAAEEVAEKLRIAKQTQEAAERLKSAKSETRDRAMREFSEDEVARITKTPPDRVVPLKTSAGETSLTRPVKILDESGRAVAVFKPSLPSGNRPAHADIKAEQVASRLAKRLDAGTPASVAVTMEVDGKRQEGILVRFIEGSDLTALDAGTQRAVKGEVAKDKVMSVFLGDHDRHAGNYFVASDGTVFNIDHGWCDLAERPDIARWDAARDVWEKDVLGAMRYRAQVPGIGDPIIQGIDNQISYEDLAPTIDKIRNMDEGDIRALLSGVTPPGEETERAVQTLLFRKDHLDEAFSKFRPIVASPTAASPRRLWLRWWAGVRQPIAVPQPA